MKTAAFANAFIGKKVHPTDAELAAELGAAKPLWDKLLHDLAREFNLTEQEWNSYSQKAGWSLRLKQKDRNIVYLSPARGSFLVSFALGDKAIEKLRHADLPKPVLKIINEAKRYAEGTAVRVPVNDAADIAVVKQLTRAKLG